MTDHPADHDTLIEEIAPVAPAQHGKPFPPYRDTYPLLVGGKAELESAEARWQLFWFGGDFPENTVRNAVYRFIPKCYPEAQDIKLWRNGEKKNSLIATFRVNRKHSDFRESRYEAIGAASGLAFDQNTYEEGEKDAIPVYP
jgi:hypothetical protein